DDRQPVRTVSSSLQASGRQDESHCCQGSQLDPQNTRLYRRSVRACSKGTLRSREGRESDRDQRPLRRCHSAPRRLRRGNREQRTLPTNTRPHNPIRTRTTTETLTDQPRSLSPPSNLAGIELATRLVPSDGCPAILLIVRETLPAGSCPEGDPPSSSSPDRICHTCSEERRLESSRLFGSRATEDPVSFQRCWLSF